MRIVKVIYLIAGLVVFYIASATGFYKYGIPTGVFVIIGAYAIVIFERRRNEERNK